MILMKIQTMVIIAINEDKFYIMQLWLVKGEQGKSAFQVFRVTPGKRFLSYTAVTHT